jgi:predicted esterase
MAATPGPAPTGLVALGLSGSDRDGAIYVPSGYRPGHPAPLALALHGATGSGRRGIARLADLAERSGLILVAPDSRDYTWDVVLGRLGPDVEFIDRALELAFTRYAVDPARVAVEGFSDGASYALSLGLINGDLFARVVAFSPGFLVADRRRGTPRLFVSHGTRDAILPIETCGRRVVRDARREGYDVRFVEFDGGHTVPGDVAGAAMDWILAPS